MDIKSFFFDLLNVSENDNSLKAENLRYSIALLIIILNILSYKHTRQRFSVNDSLLYLNTNQYYFINITILLIINLFYLYYLDLDAPADLPKYWYIAFFTICFLYVFYIYDSSFKVIDLIKVKDPENANNSENGNDPENANNENGNNENGNDSDDDNMKPPPKYLYKQKIRYTIYYLTILLIISTIVLEYIINQNNNSFYFPLLILTLSISLIINLTNYYYFKNFKTCIYNLPSSWKY